MKDPGPYYRPPGVGDGQRPARIRWLPVAIGVVLAGLAAVVLLILLYPASFGINPGSNPSRFGFFGGVFGLFFVLLVVFFIVRVLFWSTRASRYGRRYGPDTPGGYGPNRPVMVARMRYARGEITREQYDQIIQDLGRRPGSP